MDMLERDAGRQAIWAVVHEVWQLLDDGETDGAGKTTIDQERWQAVSDAMDRLEALVPDTEGPFWGGYPVNYFWPATAGGFLATLTDEQKVAALAYTGPDTQMPDAVAWERRTDKGDWLPVIVDDIPHYRGRGQAIRALGVISVEFPDDAA